MNTFSSLSFEKYKSFFSPAFSNEMKNIIFTYKVVLFTVSYSRMNILPSAHFLERPRHGELENLILKE